MSASVGSRRAGSKAWGGWAVVVAVLLAAGCGKTSERKDVAAEPILDTVTGTLTDMRDGKAYRTVVIGQQRWMAENLNFATDSSVCYKNADSNCTKYGRLYTWDDAMKACPAGWRVPSDAEWDSLRVGAGVQHDEWLYWKYAGKKLKSKSGRKDSTDYSLSTPPSGVRLSDDSNFSNAGNFGGWWSATEGRTGHTWYRDMYIYHDYVSRYDDYKTYLYSVRCVEEE